MKMLLPTIIAGLWTAGLSAAIVVPATTTTFAPPSGAQIVNATNWDNGAPIGQSGLISMDGTLNNSPTDYQIVQTAGIVTSGFNRTFGGVNWWQTGGILQSGEGSGAVILAALQSDSTSTIDFLSGSGGSLTISGFAQSDFETLWNQGRLQFDSGNAGLFLVRRDSERVGWLRL